MNRRRFLATAGAGSALAAIPLTAAERMGGARLTAGLVDCQSHLFFPEVLDLMRKRKTEPLVYDRDGTTFLKMSAPIEQGAISADLCHLGNIGTRLGGQRVEFDPVAQRITRCGGREAEANALLTRTYRAGYEPAYQG